MRIVCSIHLLIEGCHEVGGTCCCTATIIEAQSAYCEASLLLEKRIERRLYYLGPECRMG